MNFNKAIVVGNLTRDPEARTLPSGQTLTSFSVATNRVWNDQEGNRQESTEFHNIIAFGKLADICSRYLSKGRLVLIEGRLQTRSWEDQNGVKRYRTEIIADNMQMGPRTDAGSQPSQAPSQPAAEANMPSQEEIPVIEAEEPLEETKKEKDESPTKEKKEGVDVKNIPF
jgi:single-strand DNA-binding protein